MITPIISGIIISILVLFGYFAFQFLARVAKQNAEKEFSRRNWELQNKEGNLNAQYAESEQQKNKELNEIIYKQETVVAIYRKAYENLLVSEKIRHRSAIKVDALQKRIDQLQSELYQARKRAERLANKTKNAVQINT